MQIPFSESSYKTVARPYYHNIKGKKFNIINLGVCSYGMEFVVDCFDYGKYVPNVLIGNFCSLANNITFFMGYNHEYKNTVTTFPLDSAGAIKEICKFANIHNEDYFPSLKRYDNHFQIILGNDVWIGRGVLIMGGVKIGSGAIIGTNSVVAKNIPPYAIAVGNPARIVKYRFDAETIKKIMAVKWWNWDIKKILNNIPMMKDTEKFLAEHYKPEMERIPYAKIGGGGAAIEQYRAEGRKIYSFIADFRALQPLWKRIVRGFLKSTSENAVLLFFMTTEITPADYDEIMNLVETLGFNDGKIIHFIPPVEGKIFEPYLLRNSTHFITTREFINIDCLDYLYDTEVKIISALDDNIFEGEPEVNWEEIYK